MRNLFFSLFLALGLLSGCGVVKDIAITTCANGSYNAAVCPNLLDRMVPKAPAVKASPKKEAKCQVKTKTWRRGGTVFQESTRTCKPEEAGLGLGGLLWALLTLLTSRRKERSEWFGWEALGHLEARKVVWAIEDELYKARWIERGVELWVTMVAFSGPSIALGAASALLAHRRFGWASIFALFLSTLLWGSALEWALFGAKALITFTANTDEGFTFLRWCAHQKWRWEVSRMK
jgi:hypothetical protein